MAGIIAGLRADGSFCTWIVSGAFTVQIGFLLDPLPAVMPIDGHHRGLPSGTPRP